MLRLFLSAIVLVLGLSRVSNADAPNIVMFYIDDLGWADVGFTDDVLETPGTRYHETPAIDQLARESVIFWNAYSNGPNCAPSRASLMTGLYTPRHGIFTVGDPRRGNHAARKLEPSKNKTVLANKFVTLAEALQSAGYRTASMGKWHLGKDPTTQGFDLNIAGREWGSPSGGGYHSPLKYPNLNVSEEGIYLTDALIEKACEFIEQNRSERFFLYLTHYAVHTPIQAKPDVAARYRNKTKTARHDHPEYAAMVESVDQSVASVLAKLNEYKLRENTLVIFHSDNGGHGGVTKNSPLRGAKGMLYEGGIRVPLVIHWPGVTPQNVVCQQPVMSIDLYPTLLEIAGIDAPDGLDLDGVSLVPLLKNPQANLERDAIFWHFPCYLQGKGDPHGGPFRTTPAGAIRMGDWKLIEWFESGRTELYHLTDDIGEQHDLAHTRPDKRKELLERLRVWQAQTQAPIPSVPNPRFREK